RRVPGPDVGDPLAGHLDLFIGHHRPGREVQARIADARAFAQEQLDRAFLGPDGIEGHESPERHGRKPAKHEALPGDDRAAAAGTAAAGSAGPAPHQHAQMLLPALDQLVDLGNLRPALAGSGASAATVLVAVAIAPAAPVVIAGTATAAPGAATSCHGSEPLF